MDLATLDNWISISRALVATGILLGVAKLIGVSVAGKHTSIHLQLIVGINCIGLIGLALGWLPQPIPLLILLAVLLTFGLFIAAQSLREVRQQTPKPSRSAPGWSATQPALGLLALLVTAGPALTYPSGWDELVYHIELPRRWMDAGALTFQADLPYSALPSLPEIVVWLVAPIEHLVTPRMLVWVIWVNGILVFRESIRQVASPATAEVLVWSLAASRVSLMISANCYVECFLWADTAALCGLLLTPNANTRESLGLAGLLVGAAIATKMTSVGLAAFLPVGYLLLRSQQIAVGRQALVGAIIACAFATPFYLRPWLLCGNPFSPYFAALFTTDDATLQTSEFHHGLAAGNFGVPGWLGFVIAPVALAFARELYDGTFGVQWIVILSCGALAAKHAINQSNHKGALAAMCLCGLLYVFWFASSQQARFAVPFLMLGIFACAGYIAKLELRARRLILVVLGVLTLYSVPWINSGYYLDSWLCVMKIRSPIDYIRDGVGDSYAELALYLHSEIPSDEKVLTIFEHRLAYLPAGVEIATPYFQHKHFANPESQASADELFSHFKQHDIKYVVLTLTPLGPDVSQQYIEAQRRWFRGIDECIATGKLKVVWRSESHVVTQVQ